MRLGGSRVPRKWRSGELWALAFLLTGLVIVLFVAATNGDQAVWMLWIAVPMLMASLVYLLLVNAIPLFFGPSGGDESGEEQLEEHRKE